MTDKPDNAQDRIDRIRKRPDDEIETEEYQYEEPVFDYREISGLINESLKLIDYLRRTNPVITISHTDDETGDLEIKCDDGKLETAYQVIGAAIWHLSVGDERSTYTDLMKHRSLNLGPAHQIVYTEERRGSPPSMPGVESDSPRRERVPENLEIIHSTTRESLRVGSISFGYAIKALEELAETGLFKLDNQTFYTRE